MSEFLKLKTHNFPRALGSEILVTIFKNSVDISPDTIDIVGIIATFDKVAEKKCSVLGGVDNHIDSLIHQQLNARQYRFLSPHCP